MLNSLIRLRVREPTPFGKLIRRQHYKHNLCVDCGKNGCGVGCSRKNKLYFAFRELGRAIRTIFLLDYINDVELRRTINAATNKSEEFNNFVKWLFFGGEGVIAENVRHEQRKVIKYSQLVANMVILHNVQWMSRKLKEFQARGMPITEPVLKALSPYRTTHINRFGDYRLDLGRPVDPIDYKIKFD